MTGPASIPWTPGGRTRSYGLLGHPVAHALSPVMQNAALRKLGMDAVYLPFDVMPGRVAEALRGMSACGFAGANVTVPHKEEAFRAMDRLADSAALVGAVNTVRFLPDGALEGHNTDAPGFLRAVHEELQWEPAGRSVCVCGAGGAGRAVALLCARSGAAAIILVETDHGRAERVAKEIATAAPGVAVRIYAPGEADAERQAHGADLVVQATPLGMKAADPSPLTSAAFRKGQRAFDLVYVRPETAFMAAAHAGGARAVNGLGMLLWQGVLAFEIWNGRMPPVDAMREALRKAVYG